MLVWGRGRRLLPNIIATTPAGVVVAVAIVVLGEERHLVVALARQIKRRDFERQEFSVSTCKVSQSLPCHDSRLRQVNMN
jgi:hypothetical protein